MATSEHKSAKRIGAPMAHGIEMVMALHRKVLQEEAVVEKAQAEIRTNALRRALLAKNLVPKEHDTLVEPPERFLLDVTRLADDAQDSARALQRRVDVVVDRLRERVAELTQERERRRNELARAREQAQREAERERERAAATEREGDELLARTEQTAREVDEKRARLEELRQKLASAKARREKDFHRMLCVAVDAGEPPAPSAPRPERKRAKTLLFPHLRDKK